MNLHSPPALNYYTGTSNLFGRWSVSLQRLFSEIWNSAPGDPRTDQKPFASAIAGCLKYFQFVLVSLDFLFE